MPKTAARTARRAAPRTRAARKPAPAQRPAPARPLQIGRLNHLHLVVGDLRRSKNFYCDVLGMTYAWGEEEIIALKNGDTDFFISSGRPVPDTEGLHFGFRLPSREAVDYWAARVKENGASITGGPGDRGSSRVVYFKDPDGYEIEIYSE